MTQMHSMEWKGHDDEWGDLWKCPICGYEFWVIFEPFRRKIVEYGDPYAAHSGFGKRTLKTIEAPITKQPQWWVDRVLPFHIFSN